MRYYCILTNDQLDSIIPESVKTYMEYQNDFILRECIFGDIKETINGDYLCNCLLQSEPWLNRGGATRRLLNENEVKMWRDWVGVDNVFTDISGIELKESNNE